jgi:uncharacterized DUF497 family protein
MVRFVDLAWDEINEAHIARHGVIREEVEEVVRNAPYITKSRNKTYRVIGQTDGGRYLTVIVAREPRGPFFVVTARDADAPERRAYRRR